MTAFLALGAAMVALALWLLARPLLRPTEEGGRALASALALALLLPLAAAGLYRTFSNFGWTAEDIAGASGRPPDVGQMLDRLQARLREHPDDVAGWRMLGRSLVVLHRYPEAITAYERAYQFTGGRDADIDAGLAEALAMQSDERFDGRASDLLEQALQADPKNPRALWYGGVVAYNRGDKALARSRWVAVLDLGPPPEVAHALATQINRIDAETGRPPEARFVALAAVAPGEGAAAEAAAAGSAAPGPEPEATGEAPAATVHLKVSVTPALRGRVDGGGTLYVFAQDPDAPGPPLAVKRFAPGQALPLEVTLGAADAMVPGRTLARVRHTRLVARYTRSGAPQAASGDLYGERLHELSERGPVELVIDQVVP